MLSLAIFLTVLLVAGVTLFHLYCVGILCCGLRQRHRAQMNAYMTK